MGGAKIFHPQSYECSNTTTVPATEPQASKPEPNFLYTHPSDFIFPYFHINQGGLHTVLSPITPSNVISQIDFFTPSAPANVAARAINLYAPSCEMEIWRQGGGELMMMVRIKRMRVQVVDLAFVRERKYSNMFGRRGGIRLSILELSVEC